MSWLRLLGGVLFSATGLSGQASVLTWHNDNTRTGQNLQETILTPANVNSTAFGRLAVLNVDGKVDAQPLYVPGVTIPNQGIHNVLYVATEHGSLYAFDADTFTQLQHVSLIGANETSSDDHGCGQVTPEIGITATPAIDLQAGTTGILYAIAQSKDATGHYHHRLHAVDLPTLTEQFGGPVEIQATYPGKGAENTFNPAVHTERPGLLISNGVVYTSWGSHCDAGSYAGWVLAYNERTLAQVGVLNLIPNGNDGGIWSAGSGPAVDADGNVFLLTGNGTFDTTLSASGFPSKGDYGNAFVKISTSGPLAVVDYFTMLNTVSESNGDVDLGSGGLLLLPPLDNGQGTGTQVSLVVGAGKDTNLYVLDQSNLGRFNPSMDAIYQLMSGALPGGVWSSPAWFNGKLYYGAVGDNLRAFAFTGGRFALSAKSANTFVYPGTTPSISANGTSNGIVWAVENQGTAILHAYNAGNVAVELYNSTQAANGRDQFGSGNKFIVPTIANGKVYVGTTNGVGVFGLLSRNATPALTITKTHTGPFIQGQQGATYTLVVSNSVSAAATNGTITVTEMVPTGLSLASMEGLGWTCPSGGTTCSRSDVLAAGASYPAITATVNVAATAPSSVTNQVSVTGGGSAPANASDATTITPCGIALNPTSATVGAASGTASFGVTAAGGCAWGATSTASWLTVTSGASGNGNGTVGYSFASNSTPSPRAAAITVGGATFAVTQAVNQPPSIVSLSPFAGSGNQVFTMTFSDAAGWHYLAHTYLLMNVQQSVANSCYVDYNVAANTYSLMNDAGTAWMGPITSLSNAALSNSQCTLSGNASSAAGQGNNITVNVGLTFQASFAEGTAEKRVFLMAADPAGLTSNWMVFGVWAPAPMIGSLIDRYRLYSPVTKEHLYTTDLNEYNTLGAEGWNQEGADSSVFNGTATVFGVTSVPMWRLYLTPYLTHFWTTDRNEYLTLMTGYGGAFIGEGADEFLLPAKAGSSIPLYRLLFNGSATPIHFWTTDPHEESTLTAPGGGWTSEGIPGYLYPPGTAVPNAISRVQSSLAHSHETGIERPAGRISVRAIVNAASLQSGPVAPGQHIRLFGNFSTGSRPMVLMAGLDAAVISAGEGEIDAIVPRGISSPVAVTVLSGGRQSNVVQVEVAEAAPAVFTSDPYGHGQAQAVNEDGSANSVANPAPRGSIVTLRATGDAGKSIAVLLGGRPAEIISQVPLPGSGAIELRVRIPERTDSGRTSVVLRAGEFFSQPGVTLGVR